MLFTVISAFLLSNPAAAASDWYSDDWITSVPKAPTGPGCEDILNDNNAFWTTLVNIQHQTVMRRQVELSRSGLKRVDLLKTMLIEMQKKVEAALTGTNYPLQDAASWSGSWSALNLQGEKGIRVGLFSLLEFNDELLKRGMSDVDRLIGPLVEVFRDMKVLKPADPPERATDSMIHGQLRRTLELLVSKPALRKELHQALLSDPISATMDDLSEFTAKIQALHSQLPPRLQKVTEGLVSRNQKLSKTAKISLYHLPSELFPPDPDRLKLHATILTEGSIELVRRRLHSEMTILAEEIFNDLELSDDWAFLK